MAKKILINDKRLTPTMQRLRSGKLQVFKDKDGPEIYLQHEKKSMYADLIDDEWYWVEGCAECNGEERGFKTYIECEEHDRCRTCNTNRKDIKETPWGGSKGWQCQPCYNAERAEIRREAFEKLQGNEPDCSYSDDIICPHCGSKISNDDMYESQDIDCGVCGGEIHLEVEYSFHYSTTIKGERVTK